MAAIIHIYSGFPLCLSPPFSGGVFRSCPGRDPDTICTQSYTRAYTRAHTYAHGDF